MLGIRHRLRCGIAFALSGALLASTAWGVSPADKCEASKLKIAGKYGFCRLKAEAKAVKTATVPDYSKCDSTIALKWPQAEMVAGGACPSNGDQGTIQGLIEEHADTLAGALNGGALPQTDNGQRLKTGQTICYNGSGATIACAGTGQDGDLKKGLARSYLDNGNGTVTDLKTGLMWEKLSNDGSTHDVDNTFTWTNAFTKVTGLNMAAFAGHADWRLPNRNELESLVNLAASSPTIDAPFNTGCAAACSVTTCSCTKPFTYWSSTSVAANPGNGWLVDFLTGGVTSANKASVTYVRAVRSTP